MAKKIKPIGNPINKSALQFKSNLKCENCAKQNENDYNILVENIQEPYPTSEEIKELFTLYDYNPPTIKNELKFGIIPKKIFDKQKPNKQGLYNFGALMMLESNSLTELVDKIKQDGIKTSSNNFIGLSSWQSVMAPNKNLDEQEGFENYIFLVYKVAFSHLQIVKDITKTIEKYLLIV